MAKLPRAGRVKTRLAADIGPISALRFYRSNLAATLHRLRASGRWTLVLAVSPDHATLREFGFGRLGGIAIRPQGAGNLAARIERLFDAKRGWARSGPTLIIGADIPFVTRAHIDASFAALAGNDGVIGPAPDGGYWLIGLSAGRSLRRGALSGVRWSTSFARADTLAALADANLGDVAMSATLDDIDDLETFTRLAAGSGRVVVPPHAH